MIHLPADPMCSSDIDVRGMIRRSSVRILQAAKLLLPAMVLFPIVCARADDRLQSTVNDLMREVSGAVIVSNPRTGEVLAEWNRRMAFEQALPPGSTAKLVTSALALENGLISPQERMFCRRVPELLGEAYRCSHPPPLEAFTLTDALANSCNYFFSALSARLDAARLAHGYAMFGMARSGQLRIPNEPAAKARAALGESPVLVTPAQLLLAYSLVATRGTAYRLRRGAEAKKQPRVLRRVRIKDSTWATLDRGFEACVESGTGQAAAVAGVRVAGKTGTASALDGSGVTHAWFVGYAPADSPQVALVVVLARGTGAHDAAPLAGAILRRYFASKAPK